MNATDHVQSKCMTSEGRYVNFAQDPLRSYFNEPKKNEIHLLHIQFVFTSFSFIICESLI